MPAEPLKLPIALPGGANDCAVVAISLYTDTPYADVVREVIRHDATGGATGLTNRVIKLTLAGLGHPVRWTKKVDMDDHYGILCVTGHKSHAVILKAGQVIEPRETWCGIWNVDDFLKAEGYEVEGVFLARD